MSDPIKEAFEKVKEDISNISGWIKHLSNEMENIKRTLNELKIQTENLKKQTEPKSIPTHQSPLEGLKPQNLDISTGNRGVPTDRQTDQQTDRHIPKFAQETSSNALSSFKEDKISQISSVSQVLDSLDTIKKDLRSRFKKLTSQEMNIFALIYQLEQEGNIVDYPLLAGKTNLSQSSIRDYTLKLIKKGIPLRKSKENNKQITLSIPTDFKKLASLDTILSLREL